MWWRRRCRRRLLRGRPSRRRGQAAARRGGEAPAAAFFWGFEGRGGSVDVAAPLLLQLRALFSRFGDVLSDGCVKGPAAAVSCRFYPANGRTGSRSTDAPITTSQREEKNGSTKRFMLQVGWLEDQHSVDAEARRLSLMCMSSCSPAVVPSVGSWIESARSMPRRQRHPTRPCRSQLYEEILCQPSIGQIPATKRVKSFFKKNETRVQMGRMSTRRRSSPPSAFSKSEHIALSVLQTNDNSNALLPSFFLSPTVITVPCLRLPFLSQTVDVVPLPTYLLPSL